MAFNFVVRPNSMGLNHKGVHSPKVQQLLDKGSCTYTQQGQHHNSSLLGMLRKGRLDQHIGEQANVRQLVLGDGREGAALQPVLDGGALICVPISCNHWIHHHYLQAIPGGTNVKIPGYFTASVAVHLCYCEVLLKAW